MSDQQAQPVFSIEKVYVKDLSLEVPNAPQIYGESHTPEVDLQIQTGASAIADGLFETVLTITVTAKAGDKTIFLAEVVQGGLFHIRNIPLEDMDQLLGIACPNILFPYTREVISDLVTRAGFPPVVLAPLNFEVIYAQRRAQMAAASVEAPAQIQ